MPARVAARLPPACALAPPTPLLSLLRAANCAAVGNAELGLGLKEEEAGLLCPPVCFWAASAVQGLLPVLLRAAAAAAAVAAEAMLSCAVSGAAVGGRWRGSAT